MTHKAVITIKPGDVFDVPIQVTMSPGGPSDLLGYDLDCTVTEESGAHVANPDIVATDGTGLNYKMKVDTQNWPLGYLFADIRISKTGAPEDESCASKTFVIWSTRGQTRRQVTNDP